MSVEVDEEKTTIRKVSTERRRQILTKSNHLKINELKRQRRPSNERNGLGVALSIETLKILALCCTCCVYRQTFAHMLNYREANVDAFEMNATDRGAPFLCTF